MVDNGSQDESATFVKKRFPQVKIIKLKHNLGFAKAVNLAANEALGEILVLLNNDIEPEKFFLKPLLSHFEINKDLFAVSARQKVIVDGNYFYGGGAIGNFSFGFLKHESTFKIWGSSPPPAGGLLYSLYASGGAAAFNRQKILKLHGFDEMYSPFYWEDTDLSLRAWKKGWPNIVDPQSTVVHEQATTISSQFSRFYRETLASRNFILFTWRHLQGLMFLIHLFWLPFYFIRSLFKGEWHFLTGFLWAILYLPQIFQKRILDPKSQYSIGKILQLSQNHGNVLKMAMLTESIRRDAHFPLRFFKKIKVIHFYQKAPYGDLTEDELKEAVQFKNIFDLYKKLKLLHPDFIQGAEPYASKAALLLGFLAYFYSRKFRIPLILPILENRPPEVKFGKIKSLILKPILKLLGKQASLILYHNQGSLRNLLQVGILPSKMHKLPWGLWGVDTKHFVPTKNGTEPKFKGKPIILFVGRLDEAKGIQYILKAFLKIRKEFKNAILVFVGKGTLESEILKFKNKYHLQKSIILTGVVKNKDLPPYFRSASVSLYPSVTLKTWEEQLGTVNLQSLACGTPVVSTFSGAIPEYVPSGIVGILVAERNFQKLGQAVIEILKNPKLRKTFSQNGRQYVVENYDIRKIVKKAEKLTLQLLK